MGYRISAKPLKRPLNRVMQHALYYQRKRRRADVSDGTPFAPGGDPANSIKLNAGGYLLLNNGSYIKRNGA